MDLSRRKLANRELLIKELQRCDPTSLAPLLNPVPEWLRREHDVLDVLCRLCGQALPKDVPTARYSPAPPVEFTESFPPKPTPKRRLAGLLLLVLLAVLAFVIVKEGTVTLLPAALAALCGSLATNLRKPPEPPAA